MHPSTRGFRHDKFEARETLAQSIARLDRADAAYFQERAANNAVLAAYALNTGASAETTSELQRTAAFFGDEARRALFRILEG
jgi:hypothetical protein